VKDLLRFPFVVLAVLPAWLWGGLRHWWRYVVVVRWRYLEVKRGKREPTTFEQLFADLDAEAEKPELYDSVLFTAELRGVVEGCEVGDDNVLRYDVRVVVSPTQRYLRPHEIDRVVRRARPSEMGETDPREGKES